MAGIGSPKGFPKIPGSGRKAGTPNKASADIRAIAQQHGPWAIAELVKIAQNGAVEATRVVALKELLDRAYGRPMQAISTEPDTPLHIRFEWAPATSPEESAAINGVCQSGEARLAWADGTAIEPGKPAGDS